MPIQLHFENDVRNANAWLVCYQLRANEQYSVAAIMLPSILKKNTDKFCRFSFSCAAIHATNTSHGICGRSILLFVYWWEWLVGGPQFRCSAKQFVCERCRSAISFLPRPTIVVWSGRIWRSIAPFRALATATHEAFAFWPFDRFAMFLIVNI